ncbi:MAG: J domain-containing protein [Polyangiales bacterium]
MKNARKLLGVSDTASKGEIRNAFRRVASRLHPDVNSDPRAPKAFAAAVAAYRALMGRATTTSSGSASRRAQAVPAEFVCPACHDGYTQKGECPRCEVQVHARAAGPVPPAPRDREVEAMIAALETPVAAPWISIHPAARVPLMAAALVLCGLTQAGLGLWFLAIMSVGFGAFAMLTETHDRLRRPAWARTK